MNRKVIICGIALIGLVVFVYFYFKTNNSNKKIEVKKIKNKAMVIKKDRTDMVTYLYLYFYPYLMLYRSLLILSRLNKHSIVLPNTVIKYSDIVNKGSLLFTTPNINLLFGFIWVDLTISPSVINFPAVTGNRYYNIQIVDCMNQVIGYLGVRNVGRAGGTFLIMRNNSRELFPGASEDMRRTYTSSTNLCLCIICIQLLDINDMANATAFLSAFGVTSPTPNKYINSLFKKKTAIIPDSVLSPNFAHHVKQGIKNEWFTPPKNVMDMLYELSKMKDSTIINGVKKAHELIRDKMAELTEYSRPELEKIFYIGNWKMGEGKYSGAFPHIPELESFYSNIKDSTNPLMPKKGNMSYINSILVRALSVRLGTFGSIPEDSIYLYTFFDSDGNPLHSDYNYQIIIEKEPPVEAFWLLNIYSADHSQFIFPTESVNFSVNSLNATRSSDGSIQIYIWPMRPMNFGGEKINWLPSTFGKQFFLFLGMYLPMAEQIYKWNPPLINRSGKAIPLPEL